jgi:hypothetical protein
MVGEKVLGGARVGGECCLSQIAQAFMLSKALVW